MKIKRKLSIKSNFGQALLLAVLSIISFPILSHAELKIESVYPTLGLIGQDLDVNLKGMGFDENTRISMSLDVGHRSAIIGSFVTPGNASGVTVVGDTAYVADWDDGLKVIDISNPQNPQIIGSVDTPGDAVGVTVVGDMAYVADSWEGLHVIDISDPQNPQIIGSVNSPGVARSVAAVGNTAYIADGESGLQVIDINDPQSPQIIGSVDTWGYTMGVTVVGDIAYVADGLSGLVIVPTPIEVSSITVNDTTNISLTLPSPLLAGIYTLRIFNETEHSELFGAVSFTDDPNTLNSKAIIVAGGGPNASGGTMWEETKVSANKAYDALILQGYQHDSIYYISEETLNDYVDVNDISPITFLDDLSEAISVWAADASQLLIYFVDHGQEDEFILYEDSNTTLTLNVQELDNLLDTLQETMTGPVTFIYDACQSGSFISKMRPPDGKERIVITGSSYEPAYFLEDGRGSFSFQFWDKTIFNRGNLGEAFSYAEDSMQSYQSARIEANWDLEGNNNESEDISISGDITIQRGGYSYLGVHPYITSVSDPQILSSGTSATIWASGVIDSEGVHALIIPPDINPETSDIPITDLPTIELTDPDGDHVYEGVYDGFDTEGTYVIVIKARATHELYSYVSKTMTTHNIYSPPMYTSVTNSSGIQNIEPDIYEEDDTYDQANVIVISDNVPQVHNFDDAADEDWVKFYGIPGEIYKIKASNVSVFCDPVIELFDTDGTTSLSDPINNSGLGKNESLEWSCLEEGIYYVRITNANTNFGENVRYDLKVYHPIQGLPGWLMGIVMNSLGDGIGETIIKSDVGNATAMTNDNGTYLMVLPSGSHTISVDSPGYDIQSKSGVEVLAENYANLDFVMYSPGEYIALNTGWNLISPKKQPEDASIEVVLGSISDKVISVWSYVGGQWQVYDPENPGFSDLVTMDAGKGYWINMTETVPLPISGSIPSGSIDLLPGWNLVGYNSETSQDIADALASIEGQYISVWAYMGNGWKVYDPANPGFSDLTTMLPGYGYWINASEACTWTLP